MRFVLPKGLHLATDYVEGVAASLEPFIQDWPVAELASVFALTVDELAVVNDQRFGKKKIQTPKRRNGPTEGELKATGARVADIKHPEFKAWRATLAHTRGSNLC